MSSSSVVLQLSVEPCDKKTKRVQDRGLVVWSCLKEWGKDRNRYADNTSKKQSKDTHTKRITRKHGYTQRTLVHIDPLQKQISTQTHTKPCTNQSIQQKASPNHFSDIFTVKVLGCSVNEVVQNAQGSVLELNERAYLGAIGWIVHDSGLWFLEKVGESLQCRAMGKRVRGP